MLIAVSKIILLPQERTFPVFVRLWSMVFPLTVLPQMGCFPPEYRAAPVCAACHGHSLCPLFQAGRIPPCCSEFESFQSLKPCQTHFPDAGNIVSVPDLKLPPFAVTVLFSIMIFIQLCRAIRCADGGAEHPLRTDTSLFAMRIRLSIGLDLCTDGGITALTEDGISIWLF